MVGERTSPGCRIFVQSQTQEPSSSYLPGAEGRSCLDGNDPATLFQGFGFGVIHGDVQMDNLEVQCQSAATFQVRLEYHLQSKNPAYPNKDRK